MNNFLDFPVRGCRLSGAAPSASCVRGAAATNLPCKLVSEAPQAPTSFAQRLRKRTMYAVVEYDASQRVFNDFKGFHILSNVLQGTGLFAVKMEVEGLRMEVISVDGVRGDGRH